MRGSIRKRPLNVEEAARRKSLYAERADALSKGVMRDMGVRRSPEEHVTWRKCWSKSTPTRRMEETAENTKDQAQRWKKPRDEIPEPKR